MVLETQNPDNNYDYSPIVFSDKEKERMQRQAIQTWCEHNKKGTVEAATGSGKTLVGLMAIKRLWPCSVVIVVPKTDLQQQWHAEIKRQLPFITDIGLVGDGHAELDKKVRICIVNSIREKYLFADLLIMDEFHRYASEKNVLFLEKGEFKHILGLTATVTREDGEEYKILKHAPKIFTLTQQEAITNGLLMEYDLVNVASSLTTEEYVQYKEHDEFVKEYLPQFNGLEGLQESIRRGGATAHLAGLVYKSITKRRNILLHSRGRIEKAVLISSHERERKQLIFCEYIETADEIQKILQTIGLSVGKYHSGMKYEDRRKMLQDFKEDRIRVMVAVRALDEGTDVPNCEVGIIVGGSSVSRQMIQRMGRLLRVLRNKQTPTIYQLYIENTQDEQWLRKRSWEAHKNAKSVRWV